MTNHMIITGTLREDQCTFFIMPRSFLLRMRDVTDKSRENQNTLLCSVFFFPEIVPFVRKCGKVL